MTLAREARVVRPCSLLLRCGSVFTVGEESSPGIGGVVGEIIWTDQLVESRTDETPDGVLTLVEAITERAIELTGRTREAGAG